MTKIAVLGGGSWGTALAISLASKGHDVRLWDRKLAHVQNMQRDRENKQYLPDCPFPTSLTPENDLQVAVKEIEVVVFAIPAQGFGNVLASVKEYVTNAVAVVNTAKGIEMRTLLTLSQVAASQGINKNYVALCGPSHAEEVGKGLPTTLVAAAEDSELAEYVQDLFMTERLRVYTSTDVLGVEIGGALKNIIALGAGISDGMGFGDNAKAAMMTRGITEMSRLGVKMGAQPETFSGLTGIGDLIVTCTSMHSRNRRCGMLIGEGLAPDMAVDKIGMVVEGFYTTEAAFKLAEKYGVEMPITNQIYHVLKEGADAKAAVINLMTRQKKHEAESIG